MSKKARKSARPARKSQRASRKTVQAKGGGPAVLVATRKGAFILRADSNRRSWKTSDPIFLGHTIHHLAQDPRDPRAILMAARTGHLGPTVFRSEDFGKTWKEAARPPAFAKASGEQTGGPTGRVVDHVFWLTPGHKDEPGVWYAGTSPQGIFRSPDAGATWEGVSGFNDNPKRSSWCGGDTPPAGTPDGAKLHSVIVDPRDASHLYIGMSSGGVMESLDRGESWSPLIGGLEVVEGFPRGDQTVHDPHCVRLHPLKPTRLYQQNHCGIYRLDRPSDQWVRVGRNMPQEVGDVGFPLTLHPRDPDACWVFPMDGTQVWPRTAPGGKPAVYGTSDAGKTWRRLDRGLPRSGAFFTVKRQAMTADGRDPVGLYFGTTSGEVWASASEGKNWACIARHLPHIYALEAASLPA